MEQDYEEGTGRTWVDFLAEEDLSTLRPLVFLELTALMDHSGLRVGKTKPPKRNRKEGKMLKAFVFESYRFFVFKSYRFFCL